MWRDAGVLVLLFFFKVRVWRSVDSGLYYIISICRACRFGEQTEKTPRRFGVP